MASIAITEGSAAVEAVATTVEQSGDCFGSFFSSVAEFLANCWEATCDFAVMTWTWLCDTTAWIVDSLAPYWNDAVDFCAENTAWVWTSVGVGLAGIGIGVGGMFLAQSCCGGDKKEGSSSTASSFI